MLVVVTVEGVVGLEGGVGRLATHRQAGPETVDRLVVARPRKTLRLSLPSPAAQPFACTLD